MSPHEDGVIGFKVVGHVTDHRKWASVPVCVTEAFANHRPFALIWFLAMTAARWDREHDCRTVKVTADRVRHWEPY